MLYSLMNSPFQCDFTSLLRLTGEGDALLLLQDGVVAALQGSIALDKLLATPAALYVLQEDVEARGLVGQISPKIVSVSYTDFVALTIKHPQQVAW
ncbi:sulfur transfer complex subunit TusB [[Pantoea] beijingensis]|uniref:Protein TusB n=1 Tax=[Pantoea] beijingensis TaxID=1324864 RepID=A0A443IEN6_9GAMM|nr:MULTISPECIES: sulfurtransferase complex subunit TusB [Erwiniaceae]RWR02508.1 sulfur transfer complex subunit TusB [[Pantoea] beijingensis]